MENILENSIITEKYINELKKLNQINYENYIQSRFHLTIKYLIPDVYSNKLYQKINSLPFANSYAYNITENSYTPFIIKTDLFYELNELNNIYNQSGFLENIKEITNKLEIELGEEKYNSINLNEGEIIEKNIQLLEKFKEEHGYDPLNFSIINYSLNNKDDFNLDIYECHQNSSSILSTTKSINVNQENENKLENKLEKDKDIKNEENCSLKSLIKILDLCEINFNNTFKDIIKIENDINDVKKDKKDVKNDKKDIKIRKSKKEKEMEINSDEITLLIKKALKLKEINLSEDEIKEGINAAGIIADCYLTNEKLKQSNTKANMIYLFLISKYNDPHSMYQLGNALINGISIMKNQRQGIKLIKVAAEKFNFPNAIARMKLF